MTNWRVNSPTTQLVWVCEYRLTSTFLYVWLRIITIFLIVWKTWKSLPSAWYCIIKFRIRSLERCTLHLCGFFVCVHVHQSVTMPKFMPICGYSECQRHNVTWIPPIVRLFTARLSKKKKTTTNNRRTNTHTHTFGLPQKIWKKWKIHKKTENWIIFVQNTRASIKFSLVFSNQNE